MVDILSTESCDDEALPVLLHLAALSSPPRGLSSNVIVFTLLMSPSEFLNLFTIALDPNLLSKCQEPHYHK